MKRRAAFTDNCLALCLFFSWVKLLKYITFNRTMIQLTKTLSRVRKLNLTVVLILGAGAATEATDLTAAGAGRGDGT